MKTHNLISLAVTAALFLTQAAGWAAPGRSTDCGPNCERGQNQAGNDNRDFRDKQGRFENGHDNRHQPDERGAGPSRDFYRGGRLPPHYRGPQYVVDDWRGHGLRTPPRGYHWVQTGGDYVLVAITTGIILDLLLSR